MHQDERSALFPEMPGLTKDDIQRQMGGLEWKLSKDTRLHFAMLAPLGWTWRDLREVKCPPGVLLSLVDGSPEVAEIRVTADEHRREMSPAEWSLIQLERAGHMLVAQREMETPVGLLADLLTQVKGPEGRIFARTNMAKDGGRVFTITCQAREDIYRRRADEFLVSLSSWRLLHPEQAPLSEPLGTFCEFSPAVFGFRYPASWMLIEEALSTEGCDVRLDNFDEDRLTGRIHVRLRAGQGPQNLVSGYLAMLSKAGVEVQGRPELTPCEPKEGFLTAASLFSPAIFAGDKVEIRAHVLEREGVALLVALVGPARSMSPGWWAINKRGFEIVRNSIYSV